VTPSPTKVKKILTLLRRTVEDRQKEACSCVAFDKSGSPTISTYPQQLDHISQCGKAKEPVGKYVYHKLCRQYVESEKTSWLQAIPQAVPP